MQCCQVDSLKNPETEMIFYLFMLYAHNKHKHFKMLMREVIFFLFSSVWLHGHGSLLAADTLKVILV